MVKPRNENFDQDYIRDTACFYKILSGLRNIEEVKRFLKDILTPSEMRMIRRRWRVACLLEQGLTIRQVTEKIDVSTGTVVRIAEIMRVGRGGINLALKRRSRMRN